MRPPPRDGVAGRAPDLGPIDYALLGLLRQRPQHGYDLAAAFRPTADLGQIAPMPRNQVYGHLHRLERRHLVAAGAVQPGAAAPPRRIVHLTESGDSAVRRWLDRPVTRIRDVRMAFLFKLYFSERTPGHDTAALVDVQLKACRRYLATHQRARDAAAPGSFAQLVGRVRVVAAEATIAWLAQYRAECGHAHSGRADGPLLPIGAPPDSVLVASHDVTRYTAVPDRTGGIVTYVIAEPCIGTKDASCVDVCPVDCIHSTDADEQYYIDPDECIDCGACEPACPVSAIFPEDAVPDNWTDYIAKNANYFKT